PPPDVLAGTSVPQRSGQHVAQPRRPLRKNLKRVPRSHFHDARDVADVSVWHALLKKIAHGVDEDHFVSRPEDRIGEFLGHESQIEALFVRMTGNTPEALCERLGVAMRTARTHLPTTADRVPRRVCPFDFRTVAHCSRLPEFHPRAVAHYCTAFCARSIATLIRC